MIIGIIKTTNGTKGWVFKINVFKNILYNLNNIF